MWWFSSVLRDAVIPAEAGIRVLKTLGHRVRGDDSGERVGIRTVVVALCALATVSCGFHLRGSGGAMLPPSLAAVRVVMAGPGVNEPLAVAVRQAITQAGARVVESPGAPTLSLVRESVDSQVASVRTATGKASEYTLRYAATFRLDGPQPVAEQTVRLQRDYSFDPDRVLAKEQEERELLNNMRRDAAQQIVRRLARSVGPAAR